MFSAEFNEQRLIDTIEIGVSENGVVVYGIVDGEYREVESLHLILKSAKAYNEEESGWVWQLLHYEMGQLTEDRIVPTDIEAIRKEYPHLDYWERGVKLNAYESGLSKSLRSLTVNGYRNPTFSR